ncbi:MAG: tyrosine-type recombinase/integrase [Acidimicrobiia bacterium]
MTHVVPFPGATHDHPLSLGGAIGRFLASGDFAASTIDSYELTLEGLLDDVGADFPLDRVSRSRLEAHLRARYGQAAPATYNRNLATIGSLFTWAVAAGALAVSPAAGLRRRKQRRSRNQELQANAIARADLQALWRDPRHRLRDRTLWALAYATAARAEELLELDVEHLDLANRQAQNIGKGGSAERIFWDSEAARLLARHLASRSRGPVFLADKAPAPARQPAAGDLDPETGRARLSYRRAAEIFKTATGGRTLHKLRHSRLTHLAEAGENISLIKALSRHRSLRSLERYVNPSNEAVARLTDRHDPNRRRR